MWGGRFGEETDKLVEHFNASIAVDQQMAIEDIRGSIAHATMLSEQGILTDVEAHQIIEGLESIRSDIVHGHVEWNESLEDVHMNIEQMLTDRIGPVGGKLHTARSRNDQVATDFRLWIRTATRDIIHRLDTLRTVFVDSAEQHMGIVLPGYTHLQVAQPVLLSHHWLAYYEMFTRDRERLTDSLQRLNISPLGACALAGTGFPVDPHRTARLLAFHRPFRNSLDAVSDRDFALEFLAHCSIAMIHISRLSEELILWSSAEFGFVTLPDSHTTGSSIMPQKKNPDVCELLRGKTGRVCGYLVGLLMVMKGLPLAYNKDTQEDKEGVFDSAATLAMGLELLATMLPKIVVHTGRMQTAATRAYSNATDLADYLAKKGVPFREAHELVGKLVALSVREGKALEELSLAQMQPFSNRIEQDVFSVLSLKQVIGARDSYGGTAQIRVQEQIERARKNLRDTSI